LLLIYSENESTDPAREWQAIRRASVTKIDIFPHILPKPYFDKMLAMSERSAYMQKRVRDIPVMYDLDTRFRIMEQYDGYRQVLTLNLPPIEFVAGPKESPDLAKLANDSMAELVRTYPHHFPAFVASLPLNNPDATIREAERSVQQLGARGVQIGSNVNGRPLDDPQFRPLFSLMSQLGYPIWLHPTRSPDFPDYKTENRSKYDLWWAFGWPYETSVAMGRLALSGVFDENPELKIITHHMGAMIPYFEGRIGPGLDQLGRRSDDELDASTLARLKKRPYDYFRMFYADTALFGALAATECGLAFFGSDHVLFGTDMPFDPEKGTGFIRETIRVIDNITASIDDKKKIYEDNARRLLRLG
jgi:predicted TIM-barrel fold metal-dependent hydrolase